MKIKYTNRKNNAQKFLILFYYTVRFFYSCFFKYIIFNNLSILHLLDDAYIMKIKNENESTFINVENYIRICVYKFLINVVIIYKKISENFLL
ncbi:hypothetical protein PFMC_03645 [Plasmodium falciparum CAMP/Malaysia]|uniref:Uncharacterized protein n=1 Tax=Plasmodium falciparum (isolate Camp / Malaysia) TaxID=5835 RepID=A0A024X4D8_PLAFC|nr:hypothetical protein PFMC_03645 [Plasmodium falciparum CAMP/Malaysia]